ncbi:hypothetical protein RJ639_005769 [Escallonia herrerae]|uniref:Cytochrome P450 n=1 Tax=Escallonia herrerae TaxID=1293975 RepID=A0AA88VU75_9ASTE|nr:hypothetical protein RJ639_005769 [Escallonia herrerae]
MELHILFKVVMSLGVLGFLGVFLRLYHALVVTPNRLGSLLRKQGINGPPQKLLLGNILEIKRSISEAVAKAATNGSPAFHECEAHVFPFLESWRKQYGDVYMFALGNTQTLSVTDPDTVREIIKCTSLDLGKPSRETKEFGALLGQGIITSSATLVDTWESIIENQGGIADIKVDQHLRCFAGDVISRACFVATFPGIKRFSRGSKLSKKAGWALEKELRKLILKVVKERNEVGDENDLLQTLLDGAKNGNLSQDSIERFVVHNCKNIYLAAETTGLTASWCLMLLASNQEWQDRVRAEALQVCKGQIPNVDMVLKLKQDSFGKFKEEHCPLNRPFPILTAREALEDIKFGGITVPKGVDVWIVVTRLHTDPEIWGPDAYKFNPERFASGVTGACKQPHMYMPFGFGPRVCPGQNLALAELKVLIAVIVAKFSFSLSPKYMHKPSLNLNTQPGNGVDLLVKKL